MLGDDGDRADHAHIVVEDAEDVIHPRLGEAELDRGRQAKARKRRPKQARAHVLAELDIAQIPVLDETSEWKGRFLG